MKEVIFVLGPPGSGKGTQCENIVRNFGYVHLSAGDILRKERARENSIHREILEECFRNIKVVPSEITCSLLREAMDTSKSQKFIIDAFPINEENLNHWNRKSSFDISVPFVLYLECPQEVCIERCLKRGDASSKRSDDNLESLEKRFVTFLNDSLPVIEHYRALKLLKQVYANKGANEVFADVKSLFEKEIVGN